MIEDPQTTPQPATRPSSRVPLIIAIVAATGGLILVCLFLYLLLGNNGDGGPEIPDLLGNDEPTPTVIVPTIPAISNPSLVSVRLGDTDAVSLTLDAPTFLHVADRTFSIQGDGILEGQIWSPTLASENSAAWINGTVVNYVLALADTETNRNLMQSLASGDPLVLESKSGPDRTFAFESRGTVNVNTRDVFAQTRPGLTILLVGLGPEVPDRMIVQARYVVEDSIQSAPDISGSSSSFAALGEVAQLGDELQLTVTTFDKRAQDNAAFAFYLVDYQLNNTGANQFDASNLRFTLVDDVGNQYALNAEASLQGNQPPLGVAVPAGSAVQATAGYQIPAGLDANSLAWRVVRADTGDQVEVRVSPPTGDSAEILNSVRIDLINAEVSLDGGSLLMEGQITNQGTQTVLIDQDDVSLVSNGAVYLIVSTSPAFPWVVNAGQTVPYSVAVQRPINAADATFTILNQSWQLTGLR